MAFKKGNTFGFKKGQSGNPAGRPKALPPLPALKTLLPILPKRAASLVSANDLRDLAKEYAPLALRVLGEIAIDKGTSAAARVAAAAALLDRGYGRATQTVDVDARISLLDKMTVDEQRSLSAALAALAAAEERAAGGTEQTHH